MTAMGTPVKENAASGSKQAANEVPNQEHSESDAAQRDDEQSPPTETEEPLTNSSPEEQCSPSQSQLDNSESQQHDEVNALLKAIHIMSRLAAMDSSAYSATMTPSAETEEEGALALQRELDELQRIWKLEETSVPNLAHHIHRLQAHVSHLEREQDQHVLDFQHHLEHENESQSRIRKLERAVQKLHRKTEKLNEKLKQKQKERKSILKQVKEYVSSAKQKEEQNAEEQLLSHQLYAHERLLRLEQSLGRDSGGGGGGGEGGGNRSRCSSRDTVFSDFDVAALYPMEYDEEELSSVEASSVSSASSTGHSTVTEEGVATVRYHSGDELPSPGHAAERHHDYVLTFPRGAKIGLQFQKIPLEKPSKKGLLDDAFALDSISEDVLNKSSVPIDKEPLNVSTSSDRKPDSFSINFNFDALLGKNQGQTTVAMQEDEDASYAFLVCGYHGFDSQLNVRPTLGARLVKVDSESVDRWTVEMIREATHTYEDSFTMTFRNEPLSDRQLEILTKAIKAAEQLHGGVESGNRAGLCGTNVEGRADGGEISRADTPKEKGNSRSMLSSLLQINQNGAADKTRSGSDLSARGSDDSLPTSTSEATKSATRTVQLSASSRDQPVPGTPPSEKLKKSMKSMGKKFKGWMS